MIERFPDRVARDFGTAAKGMASALPLIYRNHKRGSLIHQVHEQRNYSIQEMPITTMARPYKLWEPMGKELMGSSALRSQIEGGE